VLRATKIALTELAAIRGSNSQLRLTLARNCNECIFEFFNRIDPKQTFTLPIPGPSRRQEVPLVRVGVIGGLESVVDITCQPRRAVLLFESLL
jgi:hypothetical protein